MNKKLIINIALSLVAVLLAYLVFDSVRQPIVFNDTVYERQFGSKDTTKISLNQRSIRQRLIDIKDAQVMYKQMHNHYADNFDTLIAFVKFDSIPVIHSEHDKDDTTYTKTIDRIVRYDKVLTELFGTRENFYPDSLCFIPYSKDNSAKFELEAGFVARSGVKVPVFEARAKYEDYLWDLDQQRVRNLAAEAEEYDKYPGLKIGAMTEPSLNGNW